MSPPQSGGPPGQRKGAGGGEPTHSHSELQHSVLLSSQPIITAYNSLFVVVYIFNILLIASTVETWPIFPPAEPGGVRA